MSKRLIKLLNNMKEIIKLLKKIIVKKYMNWKSSCKLLKQLKKIYIFSCHWKGKGSKINKNSLNSHIVNCNLCIKGLTKSSIIHKKISMIWVIKNKFTLQWESNN